MFVVCSDALKKGYVAFLSNVLKSGFDPLVLASDRDSHVNLEANIQKAIEGWDGMEGNFFFEIPPFYLKKGRRESVTFCFTCAMSDETVPVAAAFLHDGCSVVYRVLSRRYLPHTSDIVPEMAGKYAVCVKSVAGFMGWGFGVTSKEAEQNAVEQVGTLQVSSELV